MSEKEKDETSGIRLALRILLGIDALLVGFYGILLVAGSEALGFSPTDGIGRALTLVGVLLLTECAALLVVWNAIGTRKSWYAIAAIVTGAVQVLSSLLGFTSGLIFGVVVLALGIGLMQVKKRVGQ